MSQPVYRAIKSEAFLGLVLSDLVSVIGDANWAQLAPYVLPYVQAEPSHVGIVQDGQIPEDIVRVEVIGYQVDAGLNEIPRGTCLLAHGRDAQGLIMGYKPAQTVAVAHYLERYLSSHVRAKLYHKRTTTSWSGIVDSGDNDPLAGEWEVVFDGYAIAPTIRGTTENHAYVLQLTHFLAALTYTSALTADVVAGTSYPAAFNAIAFQNILSGGFAGTAFTPMGAAAASLNGGDSLYTDFWGFRPDTTSPSTGVKGFLTRLATGNLFNQVGFASAGAAACTLGVGAGSNTQAQAALSRIEPFNGSTSEGLWGELTETMREFQGAASGTTGVTRLQLVNRLGDKYLQLGYRYGVPLSFHLLEAAFNAAGGGQAFAQDIVGATWDSLGPASVWELLTTRYAARYQIAVAPSAARAVIIPAVVGGVRYWQTIHASEITDWADDLANPVNVRGVILVNQRASFAGTFAANSNVTDPRVVQAMSAMDSAYDSCRPGVFLMRDTPPWLVGCIKPPGVGAPALASGTRIMASAPTATAALGPIAVTANYLNEGFKNTGTRLAKALYQQARLLPRTLVVTTRFRTDTAPGSLVRFEPPADRFVRDAAGFALRSYLSGLVTRMTLTYNAESRTASTTFQVGFVRTEAETQAGDPLHTTGHPFWSAVCYGLPWADSVMIRNQLGNGSIIGQTG